MNQLYEERVRQLLDAKQADLLRGGKKGIEKESLRVTPEGNVAQTSHPAALGSTLTHPAITTDYSEALLELITPPFADTRAALDYLEQIHHFVYPNIGQTSGNTSRDELMWAASMPCIVQGAKSIPIAQYGTSNVGRMKHVYRRGLEARYGRLMQAISGIHFNYSVPADFWPAYWEQEKLAGRAGKAGSMTAFISAAYFGLARNVLRYEWLIAYLFGCSPALCKSFMCGEDADFQEFDAHTYYDPHATSLRMSDIGYKNKNQSSLHISYNALDEYIAGLNHAVETPYPQFVEKGMKVDGEYQQLNTHILQIVNEYYSSIRPKQPTHSGERPTKALRERGVEYVELRAVDVNAFAPLGVDEPQLRFLEAFLLYCLLDESPPLTPAEQRAIAHNQTSAAQWGRRPGLMLQRNGQPQSLQSWGGEIVGQMATLCAILDEGEDGQPYEAARIAQEAALRNPDLTPSARMLAEMRARGESFSQFALRLSHAHQQLFLDKPQSPLAVDRFNALAEESLEKQAILEASDDISFEEYLARYFAQR